MQLKLSCYQLKIESSNDKMCYESCMVMTEQKPVTDIVRKRKKNNQSKPLQNNHQLIKKRQ